MTVAPPAAALRALVPDAPDWPAFEALYRALFAAGEREPVTRLRARAAAGRYRVTAALVADGLAGFAVIDRVPEPAYAVLTFVGVAPAQRGRGLGGRLVTAAGAAVPAAQPLLVEAAPGAETLYVRQGFRRLALDYRVPSTAGTGVRRHTLMARGAGAAVDGAWLRAVIRDMFIDGYGVAAGDARLDAQLARVGPRVEVEPC